LHDREGDYIDNVRGANIAGVIKVADAMPPHGVVSVIVYTGCGRN